MTRVLFIDIETTGLKPGLDKILQIACFETINHIPTANHFEMYFNPGIKIDKFTEKYLQLSNEFLEKKPKIDHYIPSIIDYIKDAILVAHNAVFDIGFLDIVFKEAGYQEVNHYCSLISDSLELARKLSQSSKKSLGFLCEYYDIKVEGNSHEAMHDAKACYELVTTLVKRHPNSVEVKEYLSNFIQVPSTRSRAACLAFKAPLKDQVKHQEIISINANILKMRQFKDYLLRNPYLTKKD